MDVDGRSTPASNRGSVQSMKLDSGGTIYSQGGFVSSPCPLPTLINAGSGDGFLTMARSDKASNSFGEVVDRIIGGSFLVETWPSDADPKGV